MAYVANQEEDEQNQNNQVAPSGGGASVHLAPSAGVGAVGTGAGTSGNGQGQGGGSFATIDKYLTANQGNAAPLAGQITQGITNQYNTLDQQNQAVGAGINNQINNGYTKEDTGLLAQEAAAPVSFAGNAGNVAGFQGQLNDKYTGPQSAEGTDAFTKQQAALNTAITNGKSATTTEAGRAGLLQGIQENKTNGVTALNSAILSQDPNAQSSIENAYQPFQNLVTGLGTMGQQADTNIAGATKEAAKASSDANNQLQGQVGTLNSGVDAKTKALSDQFNGYNTQATATGQKAQADNSAIQTYASNTPQIGAVDTSSLNPYLNLQALTGPAPTNATSADTGDYQMQGALQTLAGANNPLNTSITQATSGQAGTALPSNFAALQAQLQGMPAAENSVLGNVSSGLNTASAPALQAAQQIQDFKNTENQTKQLASTLSADQKALAAAPTNAYLTGNRNAGGQSPQQKAAQAKVDADQKALNDLKSSATGKLDAPGTGTQQKQQDAATIGQGQWINGADTGFNSLLGTLGSSLSPVAVNNLPTQEQVTPDTTDAGFGGSFLGDVGRGFANPLLLVPKELKAAGKEAKKIKV